MYDQIHDVPYHLAILPTVHMTPLPIRSDSSLAPITTVHEVHDCDYLALLHVQNFGHSFGSKNDL